MAQLDQTQLAEIVGAVLAALGTEGTAPKAASAKSGNSVEAKDRASISGFKRKGIADVVLMDRNDPKKPYSVKPFKAGCKKAAWSRKASTGLFPISQTSELPKAKPAPKTKAKGKPAPATLPLV